MSARFNLVVVGAGMVGLTTAALAARSPHNGRLRITVVDAGTRPRFDPDDDVALRVSAISLGSVDILRTIGAWTGITRHRASPYRHMRVWDARGSAEGPETLHFDAADFGVAELGFIIENLLVRHALLEQIDALDVELRFASPITRILAAEDGHGFGIELHDGSVLPADLLVGADGASSLVRNCAGIPVSAWKYPQSALVTHVSPELAHERTAWQRFLADGPLALLPLDDGRVSVVWSTTPEKAEQAMLASDAELGALLSDASDRVLGTLTVAGPRGAFPLRAQHAERYVAPGLALVGDAAHSVHPLAGQGANLGLADASALVEAIGAALSRGEYPGDLPTLRRYERARKGANATMLHFIDALNKLFLADSATLAGLRGRGMRLFNRSGPIRQRAVQVALGIKV